MPLLARESVQTVQVARTNEAFCPLPAPTGKPPFRATPAELGIADPTDKLVFHVLGDSGGIVDAIPQEAVAAAMVADLTSGAEFAYHVGDLAYYNGDAAQWYPQVYEPYEHYSKPIIGIPGNHDGDNSDNPAVPSLTAWMANMCAPSPALTQQAGDVNRDAQTIPNCYWTFSANLVTIIGLWTNVPSGGVVEADQVAWFNAALAAAPTDRPVIVALHHPPYSADMMHGGSAKMGALIDAAAIGANRWPDMVLSGHVHDYQRFSRAVPDKPAKGAIGTKQIPYIVCGAGGYRNLHAMASDIGTLPWTAMPSVTLDAFQAKLWGFLRLTIAGGKISGSYTAVARDGTVTVNADTF